ncbi:hypothetical protein BAE44_0002414, partial [Dichanthelium oligosanthes]
LSLRHYFLLMPSQTHLMQLSLVDSVTIIFMRTDEGIFPIDLKSCRVTKMCRDGWYYGNIPYMSFYTPGTVRDS